MNKKYITRRFSSWFHTSIFTRWIVRLARTFNKARENNRRKITLPSLERITVPKVSIKALIGALALFSLFLIVLWVGNKYLSIMPQRSALESGEVGTKLVGGEVNVLVLVYEKPAEYAFVDMIGVLSVVDGEDTHKLMMLSPEFSSPVLGKQIKLRNIMSNSQLQGKPPLDTFHRAIELLLGIKIDRYIAVNVADIPEIIDILGVSVTTVDSVNDPDAGNFLVDQQISGKEIVKYLAADSEGINSKLRRQSAVLGGLVSGGPNLAWLIRGFINSERLISGTETNLSREELTTIGSLMLSKPTLDYSILSTVDSFYVQDRENSYYEPNYAAVDEQVQRLFARVEVRKEQARIEVYNGTKTAGLASRHKRLIENLGGNVIRAANSPAQELRSKLYVPNPELYASNIRLIRQVMADRVIVIPEPYPGQHAAELVLLLGEDLLVNN